MASLWIEYPFSSLSVRQKPGKFGAGKVALCIEARVSFAGQWWKHLLFFDEPVRYAEHICH